MGGVRNYFKKLLDFRKDRVRPNRSAVLWLLCIILPILATDVVFITTLINSGRNDSIHTYEKTAENIEYSFGSVLANAYSIIKNVYKSTDMNEFLEREYKNGLEYYQAYHESTSDNYLKALYSINNLALETYTENPTIINGGGVYKIDSVKDREWYQKYVESGQDMFVMFSYDTESGAVTAPHRRLYIIKAIGNPTKDKYKKLCRVVVDYGFFSRKMESVATGAEGYIADDENVFVYTGGNNYLFDDYMPLDTVKDKIVYEREYTYYGTTFDILISAETSPALLYMKKRWPVFIIMLLVNAVLPLIYAKLTQAVNLAKIKEQEFDIARQQAELLALHSQINPHFLFNALESIRMHSVLRGEKETAEMVEKLAVIERNNADWNEDRTTVEREMDFVKAYLGLQQYRFGDRLSYDLDVEEKCLYSYIPRLTIVTFVENACVHGIEAKSSPGWIFVRVYYKDEDMVIEVEDTGGGLSDEAAAALLEKMKNASIDDLKQAGRIGMINACLRLRMATEDRVKFMVESEKGVGTTVTVIIPKGCTYEKSIAD